jgi:hypothetical protein
MNNNEYVFLQDDALSGTSAPGFAATSLEKKLVLQPSANTLRTNYIEGMGLDLVSFMKPYPVDSNSFITLDISATVSASIFTILTTPPNAVVDSNGTVLASALTIDTNMYAQLLSITLSQAREVRNILYTHYYGTQSLLENIATYSSQIIPIDNNPGMFIFYNDGDGYLFKNDKFGDINDMARIGNLMNGVNPYSFITLDIDQALSVVIYNSLSKEPNIIIGANGRVDLQQALNIQPAMLATLCNISIEQAYEVKNILLSSSLTGICYESGTYVYVEPDSFQTKDIDKTTSERVYTIFRTPPK